MQLKIHSADHLGTIAAFLLQPEQVTKEVEVGKDSEIRLTEWMKIDMCNMVFGWRLHKLTLQNSSRSLRKG